MNRRSSAPLWLLGAGSVVLILATLAFFLVRQKVCPDCGGAGAVRFPDVQMSRGNQPTAPINCPRCRDRGKVSLFQSGLGPRFAQPIRELILCEQNGLGDSLEVPLDALLRLDGRSPVDIVGWTQPSPSSYSGWACFIGDSHVLYMNHSWRAPGRKIASAVLIDRQGHVADHLSCSVDPKQGWVAPRFNAEGDGGLIQLCAEERGILIEFQLKHGEVVEILRPDRPDSTKRGVIRFGVEGGRLKIVERP